MSAGPSRVVMLSGGAGSWGAARRVVDRHGREGLTLLFADTLIEDDDLYRFLLEAAANLTGRHVPPELLARTVAVPSLTDGRRRRRHLLALAAEASEWCPELQWIAEGRDPHRVFADKRYLGNTRADPCSAVLKRRFMRRWLEQSRDPAETVAVIGYDWSEVHRFERARRHWQPWPVEAPLCEKPYLSKEEVLDWMEAEGLKPPTAACGRAWLGRQATRQQAGLRPGCAYGCALPFAYGCAYLCASRSRQNARISHPGGDRGRRILPTSLRHTEVRT